jgi:hypothetical protein
MICPVIRPTIAKNRVGRKVPLWWDKGTLEDIAVWVATRRAQGAKDADPIVCSSQPLCLGDEIGVTSASSPFSTTCKNRSRAKSSKRVPYGEGTK